VPNAFVLGAATFFLSMVPVGPPLIWGGAALWLAERGETGWAVFMVLYGLLVISSIDNFVKPYLISRGSSLSFALVFLGVLGGVLAFGLIGLFLGPVLLAVAMILLKSWTVPATQGSGPAGP
jgi:predicted PurR-regulated permease PerM